MNLNMEKNGQVNGAFLVGEWAVEPSRNVISRAGAEVHLEPRVMDVLVHLASRCGEVVSKEELVESVWGGRHVTDDVLTVSIYSLRKALGDQAREPRYVETISRRGYRWLVTAQPLPAKATPQAAPRRNLRRWVAVGLATAGLATAAALVTLSTRSGTVESPGAAEARLAYARGRFLLDQRSPSGWEQTLEHFQRAISLDPDSPAAHAGLADTYSHMVDMGLGNAEELRPLAFAAAERAVALDGKSAEGYAALGRARFMFDWDFAGAKRDLRHAAELNPDFMPVHQALAWLESATGHSDEAIREARRALELDPVNTARYMELGWTLALAGRNTEGVVEIDRALELNPRLFTGYLMKSWLLAQAGDEARSYAAYRDGMRAANVAAEEVAQMDTLFQDGGMLAIYRRWLSPQFRRGASNFSHFFRAQLYARVGELDLAIESLEQAYQKREGALAWMQVEPSFQPLHANARFQSLASRIGAQN